jgi:hypothetical protein
MSTRVLKLRVLFRQSFFVVKAHQGLVCLYSIYHQAPARFLVTRIGAHLQGSLLPHYHASLGSALS